MIPSDADGRRILVREQQAVLARAAAQAPPAREVAVPAARTHRHRRRTLPVVLLAVIPVWRRP
jgi:hypothetical protein